MHKLGYKHEQLRSPRGDLADWINVVGIAEVLTLICCAIVATLFPKLGVCVVWAVYLNGASLLAFVGVFLVQLFNEWFKEWMKPIP